jgi:hypothetical protein
MGVGGESKTRRAVKARWQTPRLLSHHDQYYSDPGPEARCPPLWHPSTHQGSTHRLPGPGFVLHVRFSIINPAFRTCAFRRNGSADWTAIGSHGLPPLVVNCLWARNLALSGSADPRGFAGIARQLAGLSLGEWEHLGNSAFGHTVVLLHSHRGLCAPSFLSAKYTLECGVSMCLHAHPELKCPIALRRRLFPFPTVASLRRFRRYIYHRSPLCSRTPPSRCCKYLFCSSCRPVVCPCLRDNLHTDTEYRPYYGSSLSASCFINQSLLSLSRST